MWQTLITYVNESKGYRYGSEGWSESDYDDKAKLYKALTREFGRCHGKVYVDTDKGAVHVGWVFERRVEYSDSPETYLCHVWVEVRQQLS